MSLQRNKEDFEKKLEEIQDALGGLVSEYEMNLQDDIQEASETLSALWDHLQAIKYNADDPQEVKILADKALELL